MKRILVLTDHMPWGHRSIARAIYSNLKFQEKEGKIRVDYVEVKAETGLGGEMYTLAYRYFPKSNLLAHRFAKNKAAKVLLKYIAKLNLNRLKRVVKKYRPDLVISCYFLHSHSLVSWRKEEKLSFKLWTVVADPWTINPISFIPGADLHLVYDEIGLKEAVKNGIPRNKILTTGWWVRQEMYDKKFQDEKYRTQIRKKMGFHDNRPVIFVGGGSLGTNALYRILPILMYVEDKVGLIFNTGTDKLAFNMVEQYSRMFRRLRGNKDILIKNYGWIDNMAEVLSASDLVLGKAGPNFLFDVVAVQRPFVAVTHIGGQEDGNIELIKKKKLGWIKEKNGQIARFLLEYLKYPAKFNDKFRVSIKVEAERNRDSIKTIYREIIKINN